MNRKFIEKRSKWLQTDNNVKKYSQINGNENNNISFPPIRLATF